MSGLWWEEHSEVPPVESTADRERACLLLMMFGEMALFYQAGNSRLPKPMRKRLIRNALEEMETLRARIEEFDQRQRQPPAAPKRRRWRPWPARRRGQR